MPVEVNEVALLASFVLALFVPTAGVYLLVAFRTDRRLEEQEGRLEEAVEEIQASVMEGTPTASAEMEPARRPMGTLSGSSGPDDPRTQQVLDGNGVEVGWASPPEGEEESTITVWPDRSWLPGRHGPGPSVEVPREHLGEKGESLVLDRPVEALPELLAPDAPRRTEPGSGREGRRPRPAPRDSE